MGLVMRLRTLLLALLFIALVLPLPTHGDGGDCGSTKQARLVIGTRARVSWADGINLRVYPGERYRRVGDVAEGALVDVIGGPSCIDGAEWWQIRTIEGLTGWLLLGEADHPLEPLSVHTVMRLDLNGVQGRTIARSLP
jgi:hypothetical protein